MRPEACSVLYAYCTLLSSRCLLLVWFHTASSAQRDGSTPRDRADADRGSTQGILIVQRGTPDGDRNSVLVFSDEKQRFFFRGEACGCGFRDRPVRLASWILLPLLAFSLLQGDGEGEEGESKNCLIFEKYIIIISS